MLGGFLNRLRGFDVFLSYASEDADWAIALEKLLSSGRYRVYRDQSQLLTGTHLDELLAAVRRSHQLMVLVSDHSARSEWVRRELDAHLERPRKRWNIAPVFLNERYPEALPPQLSVLRDFHGVPLPHALSCDQAARSVALRRDLTSEFRAVRRQTLVRVAVAAVVCAALVVTGLVIYPRTDHGRVAEARRQGEALFATQRSPEWVEALAAAGSLDRAVQELENMDLANPDVLVTYQILRARIYVGRELFERGRRDEALRYLEESTKLVRVWSVNSHALVGYLVAIADALNYAGETDRAVAVFSEAEAVGMRDGVDGTALVQNLIAVRQPSRAENVARRLPYLLNESTVRASLAGAYAASGSFDDAQRVVSQLKGCDTVYALARIAIARHNQHQSTKTQNDAVSQLRTTLENEAGWRECYSASDAAIALEQIGDSSHAAELIRRLEQDLATSKTTGGLVYLANQYGGANLDRRRVALLRKAWTFAKSTDLWLRDVDLRELGRSLAAAEMYGEAIDVARQLGASGGSVYAAIVRRYWDN